MRRLWRDPVFVVSLVVVVVAVLVGLVLSLRTDPAPAGGVVDLSAVHDVQDLRADVGRRVSAQGARVQSVPADEGFWVSDGGDRVWVQIETAGESPFVVRAGDRVSFTGQVVAHGSDFVVSPEFPAADAKELIGAGAHVQVTAGDVHLG